MVADPANARSPLTGPALHESKRVLRQRMIDDRDALDAAYRATASAAIARQLLDLPTFLAARCVLLTLPYRSEWDTRPLLEAARASGKTVALPRVDDTARMLRLHAVRDIATDTRAGYRGIPEPVTSMPFVAFDAVDWVLVPGVAFDASGGRLGYGGGFYDRLLSLLALSAARVAGAFDMQIVDQVPLAPHDLKVDLIVTDRRVLTPFAR
jgi:5-formyltetrahydrofolate cyclo-ligase